MFGIKVEWNGLSLPIPFGNRCIGYGTLLKIFAHGTHNYISIKIYFLLSDFKKQLPNKMLSRKKLIKLNLLLLQKKSLTKATRFIHLMLKMLLKY